MHNLEWKKTPLLEAWTLIFMTLLISFLSCGCNFWYQGCRLCQLHVWILIFWKTYDQFIIILGDQISGGTLTASDDFPTDGYLIDLSASPSSSSSYNYEYITIKDLMLDCKFRGGGISVINSLRTSIDNCYITHFNTEGISVQNGHETYIRNSFLGQHITAGGDPGERKFSGTAINLMGNDNAVTDVVIFSAAIGVMVSGQANTLSGVHCYNKATGFGGTGIYLKLPSLTQTRIVNCYLDYTGIVAEDPVQLTISSCFFLGDAYILLKSINGLAKGINIVDNMFAGSDKGIEIVQLDQSKGPFKKIDQVVVDRNNVEGMNLKATAARGSAQGNGTSWTVDFSPVLLFPNLINHVQYSLSPSGTKFPSHALRNVSQNRVVIESDIAVAARVFVTVEQGSTSWSWLVFRVYSNPKGQLWIGEKLDPYS